MNPLFSIRRDFVRSQGIASGMVLSGIGTRPEMMLKSPPGSMGSTFGANAGESGGERILIGITLPSSPTSGYYSAICI